jgi:Tfp pilus assembly protein PilV
MTTDNGALNKPVYERKKQDERLREFAMQKTLSNESGFTLVETLIALFILMIGLLTLAQVLAYTMALSKTYGRDSAKATAAAHDKMEELTNLQFDDTATNLTVNPPYTSNGVGLTAGGSIPPAAPAAGYVDYLDTEGARTTAGSAVYTRQWQVIDDATLTDLKRIIVTVTSNRSFQVGTPPSTTLVTEKTPTTVIEMVP